MTYYKCLHSSLGSCLEIAHIHLHFSQKEDLSLTNPRNAWSLSPFLNSCTLLLICVWHWTSGKFHTVKPTTHKPGVVSIIVGSILDKISEKMGRIQLCANSSSGHSWEGWESSHDGIIHRYHRAPSKKQQSSLHWKKQYVNYKRSDGPPAEVGVSKWLFL